MMRCCPTFHKHLFTQDEELSTSEDEAFEVGLNNNICLFDTCIFGRDNSLEKLSIITNGRTADPSRGNIKVPVYRILQKKYSGFNCS